MKKYLILIALLTMVKFGFSQTNNSLALPNFIPPSPTAYQFTKYGDLPLNEFTGLVNTSIPLYELIAGNLKLPISLSYSTNGVKVNQNSTWTGIDWRLNAGGLITRTVNDIADEATQQRVYKIAMPSSLGADGSADAIEMNQIIADGSYDSQADIFSFNFDGYSGQFFLNQNLQPVLIKNDSEIKITTVGSLFTNQAFIITTPSGVKYFFGGTNAIETIGGSSANPCGFSCDRATSYYLTKIQHPINGEINFEYDTVPGVLFVSGKTQNYGIITETTASSPCSIIGPEEMISEKSVINMITNVRMLKRITNTVNLITVDFETVAKNVGHSGKILQNIKISNNTQPLKNISFTYLGDAISDVNARFFLTQVTVNNSLTVLNNLQNKQEVYKMEYETPLDLPKRLSYAQDYFGYYNGKTTNTSTLPRGIAPFTFLLNNITADRKPVLSYAKKGVLTKIIYPTKGYTKFDYEGLPFKEKTFTSFAAEAILNTTGANLDNNQIPRYDNTANINMDFPPVYETQIIPIRFTMATELECYPENHVVNAQYFIEDTTAGATFTTTNPFMILSQQLGYSMRDSSINYTFLQGHTYKIKVLFTTPVSSCATGAVTATFSFKLFNGYTVYENETLRIKRVQDYTATDQLSNHKRIYYVPLSDVATYLQPANLRTETFPALITYGMKNVLTKIKTLSGDCENRLTDDQYYYTYINSNAVGSFYNNPDNQRVYPIVTISYGGDNFEKGGTQKVFKKYIGTGTSVLTFNETRFGTSFVANRFVSNVAHDYLLNGDLLQEINFIKKNNSYFKLTQKDNFYEDLQNVVNKFYVNIVGMKVYDNYFLQTGLNSGNTISNYFVKSYLTKSFNTRLNSTSTNEYFSDSAVPVIDLTNIVDAEINPFIADDPSVKKLTTTQTYTFGNLKGLPTDICTTVSDGTINKIKNIYATDTALLTGLTPAQSTANAKLVAQNNIGSPVQVNQYKGTELLNQQRTLFKTWNNNPEMVLPETIQTAKGQAALTGALEERVVFSEYDVKGNPTLVSLTNGTKTKYFYNTLNQVIVKVENYDSSMNIASNPLQGTTAAALQSQFPSAQITVFNYDPVNNQITSIVSPNGLTVFYEYNALHQLLRIRDNTNNIIQEFDSNFKQ